MAAQGLEQLGRGAVGGNGVARWQERAKAVLALCIRLDAAAQLVRLHAGKEVRIAALFVGVPHVYRGVGHGLAVQVQHLAFHHKHFALGFAFIQAHFDMGHGRARHKQRAFDGARRAAGAARLGVGLVGADVEQAVKAQACGDQARLASGAQAREPAGGGPELVGRHIQFVDGLEQVGDDALGELAHACVAGGDLPGVDQLQQLGLGEFGHGCLLCGME